MTIMHAVNRYSAALVALALVALPALAEPRRLDVPRSLDGERVVVGMVMVGNSVTTISAGPQNQPGDRIVRSAPPRTIDARDLLRMVNVNGSWYDGAPDCPDVVLPIQPRPDEPLRTGGPTPDFQGCHGCGFKGVRR